MGASAQLRHAPPERLGPGRVQLPEEAIEAGGTDQVTGKLEITRAAPELPLHGAAPRLLAIKPRGEVPQQPRDDSTGGQGQQCDPDPGPVEPLLLAKPTQKTERRQDRGCRREANGG